MKVTCNVTVRIDITYNLNRSSQGPIFIRACAKWQKACHYILFYDVRRLTWEYKLSHSRVSIALFVC